MSLTVEFDPQLVPWLRPFAPASFILKRRRAQRRERRGGFPIVLKTIGSTEASEKILSATCKRLTTMTLKMFQLVVETLL